MNAIITTDAIVLKSMKYRETSKIVTFYTRQLGKISAIVKGARRPKNKYGSSLEPMSYVKVVLYTKSGRDLQTVSDCDLMKSWRHLAEDIDKMAAGLIILEILTVITHGEEENGPLFNLLTESFDTLNDATKNPANVLIDFEIRFAKILGFQPTFESCISCGAGIVITSSGKRVQYHLDKGGPLCEKCLQVGGHKTTLTLREYRILERIASGLPVAGLLNLEIDSVSRTAIEHFLWSYLKYHVPGIHSLKSERVLSKILSVS